MTRRIAVLAVIVAAAVLAVPAAIAKGAFPTTISLPNGWQPEGIAVGKGHTAYVGSIPTGAIYRINLRTGQGSTLVPGAAGRQAIGLDFDRGRLYVAGGPTGKGFVYDTRTGALLREWQLATGAGATFVNDVIVTKRAAFFTDSNRAVIYRVPLGQQGMPAADAQTVPLTGDFQLVMGFNLNGIEATPNGKWLLAVQSATGRLFRIDPNTGATRAVDLGATVLTNGDGLLLHGKTLYVVQNQLNRIAVLRLDRRLEHGSLTRTITNPGFDVPTTIARHGKRLYAVNARFGTPPTPETTYTVVQVKEKGKK